MKILKKFMLGALAAAAIFAFVALPAPAGQEQTGVPTFSAGGQLGGVVNFATSLGAVSQITGPTDQVLSIAGGTARGITLLPASGQNILLTTAGAGLIVPGTDFQSAQLLTAGTLTQTNASLIRKQVSRFDWTNAMVVAIGASTAGDLTVCTLPAKTAVTNCFVIIDTPDTSTNALTVACGRTSAAYTDFVAAKDAKATANTIYGSASADRGTNVGWDLPSVTGTTDVKLHFIKTSTNLSTVLGSTGHVYLETITLP